MNAKFVRERVQPQAKDFACAQVSGVVCVRECGARGCETWRQSILETSIAENQRLLLLFPPPSGGYRLHSRANLIAGEASSSQ